jgi:hypothetical protein
LSLSKKHYKAKGAKAPRKVDDMTSEAQKRASTKYDKANTKGIYLKLNRTTDADIIEYLEKADNVQGLIKDLIRNSMKEAE